jgi:hypothetical protein
MIARTSTHVRMIRRFCGKMPSVGGESTDADPQGRRTLGSSPRTWAGRGACLRWPGPERGVACRRVAAGGLAPRFVAVAGGILLLGGCNSTIATAPSNYHDPGGAAPPGTLFGENGGLFSFGNKNQNQGNGAGALGVNAYLWRGALDTLSFMPLQSADPFGGVIITDWYSPPNSPDERFKTIAYILGRELRADAIRITIFRQVLQDGHWVDQPVSPVTVGDIENKVLERARQLRIQTASQ